MSAMVASIARGLSEALLPLQLAADDSNAFTLLVRDLGWEVTVTDELRSQIPGLEEVAGLVDSLTALRDQIDAQLDEEDPDVAATVVDSIAIVVEVIAIAEGLEGWQPSNVDVELADPQLYVDLALRLPGLLISRYFQARQPLVFGLLLLLGVFDEVVIETPAGEPNLVNHFVDWSALGGLLTDPAAMLADTYAWNPASDVWSHQHFLDRLRRTLVGLGLDVRRERVRDVFVDGPNPVFVSTNPALAEAEQLSIYFANGVVDVTGTPTYSEVGVALIPSPDDPSGPIRGLTISNLNSGEAHATLELGSGWTLVISGALDVSGAMALELQPGAEPQLSSLPAEGAVSIALRSPDLGDEPRHVLLGSPIGTRLEAAGVEVGLALDRVDGADEFVLEAATIPAGDDAGLAVVVEAGEGDSFVNELLGGSRFEAGFDGGLRWSSLHGLSMSGAPSLEIDIPLGVSLGPIQLHSVGIELGPGSSDDTTVEVGVGVAVGAELGPFVLVIDGVGIVGKLMDAGAGRAIAHFGDLAIGLDFKPPNGIGVSVAVGPATGGGYLYIDAERGEYAGIIDVGFMSFGLTAIGILNTQLPDGSPGWSLFFSITARFSALPLGFGFTLNGVGGLIGINRRLDDEALLDGLQAGVLDGLMFPDDPIADAPLIIDQMNDIFPIAPGSFVFGPMVEIGWGIPTVLRVQAGVVLSVPDLIVAIIGQVSMVMPDDELALLDLHLDVAGIINVPEGSLTFLAELRDSSVYAGFARLALSGSIGFQIVVLNDPRFLLSIGGWHKDYDPPADFPWAKGDLRRMSGTLELLDGDAVTLSVSAFFAITPNTVQFGVSFTMTARAMGFSVEGGAGFSTLIRFSPFMISANAYVFCEVKKGNWTLAGVSVDLNVNGPGPWIGDGTATFTFLGLDKDFHVHASLGATKSDPPPDQIDVVGAIVEVLDDSAAWTGGARSTALPTVSLRDVEESDDVEVAPDAQIELVQSVVPLFTPLTKVGTEVPALEDSYALFDPEIEGAPVDPEGVEQLDEWFATSDFVDRSRSERLNAKGYEQFPSGIRFGTSAAQRGARRDLEVGHEQIVVDPDISESARRLPLDRVFPKQLTATLHLGLRHRAFGMGDRLHELDREARRTARPFQGVSVSPTDYIAVDVQSFERIDLGAGASRGAHATLLAQTSVLDVDDIVQVIPRAEWDLAHE